MGTSDEGKAFKPEKSSSAAMDNNNIHAYHDWATMQAYYGPRPAVPPYLNSTVASPHAPNPYMWGPPQSMVPPYGHPYAAFYTHGGVYAHPGIPMAGATLSMEKPVKSPENADGGFVKKLKEIDGLAISTGKGNVDRAKHVTDRKNSDSIDSEETEDSSNGSNGVTSRALKSSKKRSRQESLRSDVRAQKNVCSIPTAEVGQGPEKLTNMMNERDLRRERRKQSNRESARRSRLRKQAEAEELAAKVEALNEESMALKSERNKLIENSEKLRLENSALMEKLVDTRLGKKQEVNLHKIDDVILLKPVGTVNLLARVDNSDSTDTKNEDGESYDQNRSSGAKLHQLLDASPRTDPVAAG